MNEPRHEDKDWILAIADALESGAFHIPIVPQPEPFRKLFEEIRAASQRRVAVLEEALRKSQEHLTNCPICQIPWTETEHDKDCAWGAALAEVGEEKPQSLGIKEA